MTTIKSEEENRCRFDGKYIIEPFHDILSATLRPKNFFKDSKGISSKDIWKDQENLNFCAFDTFGSLADNPEFDPGRLGKYPADTEISRFYTKPKAGKELENSVYNPKDARKIISKLCRPIIQSQFPQPFSWF